MTSTNTTSTTDQLTKAKQLTLHDLAYLDLINVTYFSCSLTPKIEFDNSFVYDEHGNLKATYKSSQRFKNIIVSKCYNPNMNATAIPLGAHYNLIGISISNKDDSVDRFLKLKLANPSKKTLTIKTMNKGYEYFYKLNDLQATKLKSLNFQSMSDVLFGLKCDVKYTNQIFFGPSYIQADTVRKYRLDVHHDPVVLPDWIYDELITNVQGPVISKLLSQGATRRWMESTESQAPSQSKITNNDSKPKPAGRIRTNPYTCSTITPENLELLRTYLDLVGIKRWDNYDDWLKLGSIIHNEGAPYAVFDEYSQKSDKYELESCLAMWKEYRKRWEEHEKAIGDQKANWRLAKMGTLINMAKVDNSKSVMKRHK